MTDQQKHECEGRNPLHFSAFSFHLSLTRDIIWEPETEKPGLSWSDVS